jgi:acyl dehydratase
MSGPRILVGSPWFEDLKVGQVFDDVPAVTLSSGYAALHQALFGDRLRLGLDVTLCESVTGEKRLLAHPNLITNIAIGQTTVPTQRVKGNLFYRGLVLLRPAFVGDTLHTTTRIVGLRQNRPKPGREATGLAALEIHVENQRGETVLHFWRCAMIPCRDPEARTGQADSFDAIPPELDMDLVRSAVPVDWQLDRYRARLPGAHCAEIVQGAHYEIEARDTVTCAPELARSTLNLARAHTDAGASTHGRRLVYGGHTISMASAQITRALPNLVTLLAWRSCDHPAPVFEGDAISTEFEVERVHRLAGGGGLLDLHAIVHAARSEGASDAGERVRVLDWRVIGLMA